MRGLGRPGTHDYARSAASALPTLSLVLSVALGACTAGADVDQEEGAAEEAAIEQWTSPGPTGNWTGATDVPLFPDEPRFRRVTRLTNGGTNAEAYFSAEGDRLVFQATWPGVSDCDEMYTMAIDGSDLQRVSTGEGRTTCGFYFPGQDLLLFSSTHLTSAVCPPAPDRSQGYVWGLFEYDVFTRDLHTGEVRQLTSTPGYDAEATLSPDGNTIIFTSVRSGDLNVWAMNADGSNPRQLTSEIGYEGGAVFNHDGTKIVYRGYTPQTDAELARYNDLLAQKLVGAGTLEIYTMNPDGSDKRQVTSNGASNFAPDFLRDGRIIYSSNVGDPTGRFFALYLVNEDGTGGERITTSTVPTFNAFAMFSPDGRYVAFSSDRGAAPGTREINVFLAEWVDPLP